MQLRIFNYNTYSDTMTKWNNDNQIIQLGIRIFHLMKFYFFWILMNFVINHAYSYMCVPLSFYGFLASPILAISPVCKTMDHIRLISIYTIENMWYIFGLWVTANMTGIFQGVAQRIRH